VGYEVLTVQQNDMITMLISGEPITDIAKKLQVNRMTVYNWMAKDNVKAELDKRKHDLTNQGTALMLRDLDTYITTIKELAKDKSDKRVCLAANQYLINRIYGNPTQSVEVSEIDSADNLNENDLEKELSKFKGLRVAK